MAGRVPAALRAQLGDEATFGLIEFLETERQDWSQQVLGTAADRFERRLAEELARLRTEVIQEMHSIRVDILRSSFLFWIGQVAAIAGLLSYMMRR